MKKYFCIYKYTYEISNNTNCIDGKYHNFSIINNKLECLNCGYKFNNDKKDNYFDNYYNHYILRLIKNLCKQKIIKKSKYKQILNECSLKNKKNINDKNLNEINNMIEDIENSNIKIKINKYIKNKQEKISKNEYKDNIINLLKKKYSNLKSSNDDYFLFINRFIIDIEKIIGHDVNINNNNIYLKYDTYIINHNYKGYKLSKNIITNEKDNKIKFRYNHNFFNRDVIYYTDYKSGMVDVFYDLETNLLIGYKERNKNYVFVKESQNKIIISYSIKSRLLLLGYDKKYIKNEQNNKNKKKLIKEIIRNRISNLKKIINKIQYYIFRIKNRFLNKNEEEEYNNNELINKFINKIDKLKIYYKNSKIFNDYKVLNDNLFLENYNMDII